MVTFAGSAAAIRRAVGWIRCLRCEVSCERACFTSSARDIAASRARGTHTSMFLRMLLRAAVCVEDAPCRRCCHGCCRSSRDRDAESLRRYQAKLVANFATTERTLSIVGKDNASLPADALSRVDSVLAGRGIAAPFALIVARTSDGQPWSSLEQILIGCGNWIGGGR